jgi:hypothetical protein
MTRTTEADAARRAVWAIMRRGSNLRDCRGVWCKIGDRCVVPPAYVEDPRRRFEAAEGDAGEWETNGTAWVVTGPKAKAKAKAEAAGDGSL